MGTLEICLQNRKTPLIHLLNNLETFNILGTLTCYTLPTTPLNIMIYRSCSKQIIGTPSAKGCPIKHDSWQLV